MHILLVHNKYQQPGGEDIAWENDAGLLEAAGHRVTRYCLHNDQVKGMNMIALGANTIWNTATYRDLRTTIGRTGPDVAHFHNTFPLVSPAAYWAAHNAGVPVVQTLHNYRMICPSAVLFRNGHVCQECVGRRFALPAVQHGCYRESRVASGVVAAMLTAHRIKGTWSRAVQVYITLSEFSRRKMIEGGLPVDTVMLRPNFLLRDPQEGSGRGQYALFVGRLSPEKGIATLLQAAEMAGDIPLKIVGDGPLADSVAQAAGRLRNVEWLGWLPPEQVHSLIGEAAFLVVPSTWFEVFGLVIIEALGRGTPVIGAQIGGIADLVEPGRNGLLFEPGNARDLAQKMKEAWSSPLAQQASLRQGAREDYSRRFTARKGYSRLMEIYGRAQEMAAGVLPKGVVNRLAIGPEDGVRRKDLTQNAR